MDNNPAPTNQPLPQTPAAPAPASPPASAGVPQVVHSGTMMKKVLIGLAVLVVLLALAGGAYYFMNQGGVPQAANQSSVATYTPKNGAPASTKDALQQQAEAIDEPPIENDLKPVDQDINSMTATK